ncbi:MAG: hypothetical protein ACOYEJ_00220 [Mahellales bacterium]|jgi:hypothetical protein
MGNIQKDDTAADTQDDTQADTEDDTAADRKQLLPVCSVIFNNVGKLN